LAEWNCPECKINFLTKPTFTTTCPNCKDGLISGAIPEYSFWGKGKIDNRFCAFCGKRFYHEIKIEIIEPQIFEDEPYLKKSKFIHIKCYLNIQSDKVKDTKENKKWLKEHYARKKGIN